MRHQEALMTPDRRTLIAGLATCVVTPAATQASTPEVEPGYRAVEAVCVAKTERNGLTYHTIYTDDGQRHIFETDPNHGWAVGERFSMWLPVDYP
jgi:hypothetical protein